MSDITLTTIDEKDLDRLAPLWLELRDHHAEHSTHFRERYATVTWDRRREGLLRKAAGRLRLDLAREAGTLVGYCITSVDSENTGEIESVYLEPASRGRGAGAQLVERALAWLKEKGVARTIVGIGEGNESALGFYRRFGFEIRATVMEQLPGEIG